MLNFGQKHFVSNVTDGKTFKDITGWGMIGLAFYPQQLSQCLEHRALGKYLVDGWVDVYE